MSLSGHPFPHVAQQEAVCSSSGGSNTQSNIRPPPQNNPRGTILHVEQMEDRAVPAVVFTDSYVWDDTTVTVTVDDNAPGYSGLYHWNYNVHNDSFASGIAAFAVPVEVSGMASNLGSNVGWTGSPGGFMGDPNLVSWQGAPFILIGQSADFWFTTMPTDWALTNGIISDPGLTQFPAGFVAAPIVPKPGIAPLPAILVTTNLDKNNPNLGLTSLREAIDWVNNQEMLAQQFRVTFRAGLTGLDRFINLSAQLPTIDANIFIDGTGKHITIERSDLGDDFRLIDGSEDSTIKIAGLELVNGGGDNFNGNGGAIQALGSLTLEGCTIRDNKGSWGGGVYCAGNLTITDCFIHENQAALYGGGIYAESNLVLERGEVHDNSAIRWGGGISVGGGTVNIENTKIYLNEAVRPLQPTGLGGGLFIGNGVVTATITGAKIYANTADDTGGGVFIAGGDSMVVTNATLDQCQMYLNNARHGGGVGILKGVLNVLSTNIYNNGDLGNTEYGGGVHIGVRVVSVNFSGSTISGNKATISGGGIWIDVPRPDYNPAITLDNTWVVGNRATYAGGGIGVAWESVGGTPHLTLKGDTLIAYNILTDQNSAGGGLYLGRGSVTFDDVTFEYNTASFATGFYAVSGTEVIEGPGGATFIDDTWFIED